MTTIGLSLAFAALDELRDRIGATRIVAAFDTKHGQIEMEATPDGRAFVHEDGARVEVPA